MKSSYPSVAAAVAVGRRAGRPDLSRSTYFTWFSCSQPHRSYAQTFPGARILRGFRVPSHTAATPRPFPEHVFYVVFVLPATPQLRPDLSWSTYFTWFSCSQPHRSYAQTFPGARILRGFRAPSHTAATPRPFLEHVFYVV